MTDVSGSKGASSFHGPEHVRGSPGVSSAPGPLLHCVNKREEIVSEGVASPPHPAPDRHVSGALQRPALPGAPPGAGDSAAHSSSVLRIEAITAAPARNMSIGAAPLANPSTAHGTPTRMGAAIASSSTRRLTATSCCSLRSGTQPRLPPWPLAPQSAPRQASLVIPVDPARREGLVACAVYVDEPIRVRGLGGRHDLRVLQLEPLARLVGQHLRTPRP